MQKVEGLIISARNRAYLAKESFMSKLAKKDSGDSQLVVALVLIAVALGLCWIFRSQIQKIMLDLMNKITEQINKLSEGSIAP